jgi:hypothetical protein
MSELSKLVEQLNQPNQPIAQADPAVKQAIVQARLAEREYELRYEKWIYRIAILILGILSIMALAAIIALASNGVTQIPEGIVAIGSGAAGAIAGTLLPPAVSSGKA